MTVSRLVGDSPAGEIGESYALICRVTLVETSGAPNIEWTRPGVGSLGAGVTTSMPPIRSSTLTVSHLIFNPLRQSHEGQYRCRATLTTPSLSDDASFDIVVRGRHSLFIECTTLH